jgi:cell division protein FtsZ
MGAGVSVGDNRAIEAVNMAIASPLLQDISIEGARGVLVNISAREDTLTLAEVTEATTRVYEEVHEDANIILGVIFDDDMGEELQVTVIATGIRSLEEMDVLPEKVKPFVQRKDAEPQYLPFRDKGQPDGKKQRHSFPSLFNEDELDRPTFLRKNES